MGWWASSAWRTSIPATRRPSGAKIRTSRWDRRYQNQNPPHSMSLTAAALSTSSLSSFSEATAAIINRCNRPRRFDILASYLALVAFPPSTLHADPLYTNFRCLIYRGVENDQEGTHRVHSRASSQRGFIEKFLLSHLRTRQPLQGDSTCYHCCWWLRLRWVGSGSDLVHGTGNVVS